MTTSVEARFFLQAEIMRALTRAGVPVPEILDVGRLPDGRTFSLETFVAGDGGGPSVAGWADLGRTLKALHTLPHSGSGLLREGTERFRGTARDAATGLLTRLKTWPFDGRPLEAQPLIQHAPDLTAAITALEPELWQVAKLPSAVCHTDLHGGQFRWQGGRLAALLDFGDAAIGPPDWDLASAAYFNGWCAAEQIAHGASLRCDPPVALFGLFLAFHRAGRAAEQGGPRRIAEAVAFARSCLNRLP
ncbi:aminoglycoside phosphotransferase (APT) family kinase protein [Deinococcus humi]|uniref:Aminoglycoside phosphotransferase (APT) family kinase protein n=2 Tax=Deinococcus humi TaxID=662880 RepID=A0A7W8NDA8_9DEIO|nr:aminoglycoside phosphotransferase (APT) family kinase protein [Deinococcus humi]